ncbi:hypothetical protein OSB04_014529 [Centaurea solstitialis]|uniref:Uncharacterized protein n=1 Tax=Centaurea solstitialis TaxID=347529 RepID=A0AA38SX95_9ASTR|nr:hypothetical protein OSB04_014529 [Centaurea solstitialis]
MASITKVGLALVLMIVIVVSSSPHTIVAADGRTPSNRARKLATDCNSPIQRDIPGCGGEGGSGGGSSRPSPSGPIPGASRCRNGCCGRNKNKHGECICC